jgi:hypothetical protein
VPFVGEFVTMPRYVFPSWLAGREWKPVEQPNLAATLDAAPPLGCKDLADGPDTCWQGPLWWVPNPDDTTWDFVFSSYPSSSGPNEAFIDDTGTRQVTKARCPELAAVPARFRLHRPMLFGGNVYVVGGDRIPNVFVYHPVTNEFTYAGEPLGEVGPVRKMSDAPVAGVAGDVSVGGAPKSRRIVLPAAARTEP